MELDEAEDVFDFELKAPESPVLLFRSLDTSSDSSPASSPLSNPLFDRMFTPENEPPLGVAPPENCDIDRDIDAAVRATRVEKRKRSFFPIRHSPLLDPLPEEDEEDELAMDEAVLTSIAAETRRSVDELAIAEALTKLPLFVSVGNRRSPISPTELLL